MERPGRCINLLAIRCRILTKTQKRAMLMHEMALAQSLLGILLEEAAKNKVDRIDQVTLVIGEMAAVMPHALRLAFEAAVTDTLVAGAKIVFDIRSVSARCLSCGSEFSIANYEFSCPKCKSANLEITSGDELYIASFQAQRSVNNNGSKCSEVIAEQK